MASVDLVPDTASGRRRGMGTRELLTLVSAIMALMALGLDLMLPAFDDIRDTFDLGEGSPETGKIITVYFFGTAVAQLFWGPISDRFGRKPVVLVGAFIYAAGAVGSALAPSFALLLLSRFVWGVGAAGARVVAIAIVRDRFEGTAMASAMSQVMAVFMLVPVLAPALGSGLITIFPWQSVFWFCVVAVAAVVMWTFRLPETLDPAHRRPLEVGSSMRGYVEVARTRVTAGYTIATIFLQGVFTTYLASSELIISDVFDREAQFPIVFGAVACLFALASIVNGRIVAVFGMQRVVDVVYRILIPLTAVAVVIAVATEGRPDFWLFMPLLGVILASFLFLLPNLNSAAMTPVGHLAGTASAGSGAVRMAFGAVLGTIASGYISDSVTPFAVSVLIMCTASWVTVVITRRRSPGLTVGFAPLPAGAGS